VAAVSDSQKAYYLFYRTHRTRRKMPYQWTTITGSPDIRLELRPNRSLTPRGFVWFIALTSTMLALPLLAVLGSAALWGILPFMILAVAGVWWGIARNTADGGLTEVLTIGHESMTLTRRAPGKSDLHWTANPFWVSVHLHESGGPVPAYLTLKGAGREVELGAFLSPDERRALKPEMDRRLALAATPAR
jgi:uncharacterized membrane protein